MLRMIFSKQFLVLYIMNILSIATGFFTINNFKKFGMLNGLTNENYLAWVGSVGAVMNSMRFVWSALTDKFSYRTIYTILLVMQIALDFTMPLIDKSAALFALWVSLILLCEGGHFTMLPNVLKKIYGDKGTALYGVAFSFAGMCNIITIILQ